MATNPLPFIGFYSDSSQTPDSLIAKFPLIWGVFGNDRDRVLREFSQRTKRIGTK